MTEAHGPAAIAQLRAAGLLSPREIVEQGVRVVDRSRSHAVRLVEVGGRPAFAVKALDDADGDVQGSPERELAAYALARSDPALGPLLARSHPAGDGVLILAAGGGATAAARAADPAALRALAATLAAWHAGTRAAAFAPLRPWPLDLLAGEPPAFLASNDGVRALLARLPDRARLAAALAAAAARWAPLAVVHGDARLDNWLLDDAGTATLIDWETAGRGDPAWDVAAVLQDLITLSGAERISDLPAGATVFLDAYAAAAGDDVRGRLAGLLCARVLQRAVQVAAWDPVGVVPEARRHVRLATELAEGPPAWT